MKGRVGELIRERRFREFFVRFLQMIEGAARIGGKINDIESSVNTASPVIVDGGAFNGEFVEVCLENFDDPTIYAFEPQPGVARATKAKFDDRPKVHVYETALGRESNTAMMNLSTVSQTSSLYDRSGRVAGTTKEQVSVDVVSLDSFESVSNVNVLKLDVEGAEVDALRGATQTLETVNVVLVEVSFTERFDSGHTAFDVNSLLRNAGFELEKVYPHRRGVDGSTNSADVLYLKS